MHFADDGTLSAFVFCSSRVTGDILMVRKVFAAVVASLLVVGGLFADEIKGKFVKYEDGKVTVDVDGKEKSYKVDPDAKIKRKKDGVEKEVELTKMFSFAKKDTGVTLTVESDIVKNAKFESKKAPK